MRGGAGRVGRGGGRGVCGWSRRVVRWSRGVCGWSRRVVRWSRGVCGWSRRVVRWSRGVCGWSRRVGRWSSKASCSWSRERVGRGVGPRRLLVKPTSREVGPRRLLVKPTSREVEPTRLRVEPTSREVEPTRLRVEPTSREVGPRRLQVCTNGIGREISRILALILKARHTTRRLRGTPCVPPRSTTARRADRRAWAIHCHWNLGNLGALPSPTYGALGSVALASIER